MLPSAPVSGGDLLPVRRGAQGETTGGPPAPAHPGAAGLVLSLIGSDKGSQRRNIAKAKEIAARDDQVEYAESERTHDAFDGSEYLDDPAAQAELLSDALASGDARVIANALGMIARARGMTDLVRATGLSRGSLYEVLKEERNPRLDTVMKVIAVLELELRADAKDAAA